MTPDPHDHPDPRDYLRALVAHHLTTFERADEITQLEQCLALPDADRDAWPDTDPDEEAPPCY